MNRSLPLLVGIVALMPIAVDAPPDSSRDSGETRLRAGVGYGYYAFITRDCEGKELSRVGAHSLDGGFAADHRFAGTPVVVGVAGGWTRDDIGPFTIYAPVSGAPSQISQTVWNRYVNPRVAFESRSFGIGAGWVSHEREFITTGDDPGYLGEHNENDVSAHIRIGATDRKCFTASWMEGVPIYADGSYFNMGFAGPLSQHVRLFGGLAAGGPLDRPGVLVRLDADVKPWLRAGVRLQGNASNVGNVGLALETRIPH